MKNFHLFSRRLMIIAATAISAISCGRENPVDPATPAGILVNASETVSGGIQGMYLLNQGTQMTNSASIDYYDYNTGIYIQDIYNKRNPDEMGLGDTGNDMQLHRGRLYVVLNGSNQLAVVDAVTLKLIGKIAIPNPRYIAFDGAFAYVTSYAGPRPGNGEAARTGYVAKIDLETLTETAQCMVGYQPDGLAVAGGKLYVANSGGYMATPERTVSVVDLASFTETGRIEVGPGLHRIHSDGGGGLYILPWDASSAYLLDTATEKVTTLPVSGAAMARAGDKLYMVGVTYVQRDNEWVATNSYSVYNMTTGLSEGSFITDGTGTHISTPYGIAVHPANGEILIADAGNYTDSGALRCYTAAGRHHWSVSAGVIPCCMAFTTEKISD